MKQKLLDTMKHPLISGSLVMFFGSLLGSVLNFLFNLYMTNNLSAADYGILASFIAILTLAGVVASSPVPMLVNFAANYFARKDLAHVRGLFRKTVFYYSILGVFVFLFFFF